jgi:methylmalonyl-CoA/ethylmalonyl-CoA epimerase
VDVLIVGLDHVGVAVSRLDTVLPVYERLFGLRLEGVRESKEQKIKAVLFAVGGTNIELLEPLDKESPIAKFLEKRGQGIHHIAFRVDNIEEMLGQLKAKGVVLIDEKPRRGIEGGKIAFLHPKSTGDVLIELCEH